MTALAFDLANRSATFLGKVLDALDKAIAMTKVVHHDSPSASDVEKVRAIADTI